MGKQRRIGTSLCPYSSPPYFAQHAFPLVYLLPLPKMKSVVEVFHPPPSRFRIVDAFLFVAIFVGISLIDLVVLAFYILVSYVSLVSSVAFSVVVVAAAAASPLFATPVVVVHVFSGVELPVVEEMVRLSPPFPSSSPPRQSWGGLFIFCYCWYCCCCRRRLCLFCYLIRGARV